MSERLHVIRQCPTEWRGHDEHDWHRCLLDQHCYRDPHRCECGTELRALLLPCTPTTSADPHDPFDGQALLDRLTAANLVSSRGGGMVRTSRADREAASRAFDVAEAFFSPLLSALYGDIATLRAEADQGHSSGQRCGKPTPDGWPCEGLVNVAVNGESLDVGPIARAVVRDWLAHLGYTANQIAFTDEPGHRLCDRDYWSGDHDECHEVVKDADATAELVMFTLEHKAAAALLGEQLRAERDTFREHSTTLNAVSFQVAEALADEKGADSYHGDPVRDVTRLIAQRDSLLAAAKAVVDAGRCAGLGSVGAALVVAVEAVTHPGGET